MFDELLLHSSTLRSLEQILSAPSQGYLFVGPSGSGKYTAARKLANAWANGHKDIIYEVLPGAQEHVGIQAIHTLRQRLSRRLSSTERRTVLISSDAQLTKEAQNALLKLLEEPPDRTTFLLTTETLSSLLPTVRSRLQTIRFPYLPEKAIVERLRSVHGIPPGEALRAYYMGGKTLGGALQVVERLEGIEQAKQFLSARSYERLIAILPLVGKRDEFSIFAGHIQTIYEAILWQAARADDKPLARKTAAKLDVLSEIMRTIEHNGNVRLLATRFVLEL